MNEFNKWLLYNKEFYNSPSQNEKDTLEELFSEYEDKLEESNDAFLYGMVNNLNYMGAMAFTLREEAENTKKTLENYINQLKK